MSQVITCLEALWAYERMNNSTILSSDEKKIIRKELFHSLPHPMHSTLSLATRDIVASHLSLPSIKQDEETIDRSIPREPTSNKGSKKKIQ